MTELFEQDIEEQIRLPWDTICKLAVKARCDGITLDELTAQALERFIWRTNMTLEGIADIADYYGFRARVELCPA
jgi:hypothetical protein